MTEIPGGSEQEAYKFPTDVTEDNLSPYPIDSGQIPPEDFLNTTTIDENGTAVCVDPTTEARTRLVVFAHDTTTGEMQQVPLRVTDKKVTELQLPPGKTNVHIVVGRETSEARPQRGPYDRTDLFAIAPRVDGVPFVIAARPHDDEGTFDDGPKYQEALSSPQDESPAALATPGLPEALQRLGMDPQNCIEVGSRVYYPYVKDSLRVEEPLLAEPGDGKRIEVRVAHAYQRNETTRGFSFGRAQEPTAGRTTVNRDKWYMEGHFVLQTAAEAQVVPPKLP